MSKRRDIRRLDRTVWLRSALLICLLLVVLFIDRQPMDQPFNQNNINPPFPLLPSGEFSVGLIHEHDTPPARIMGAGGRNVSLRVPGDPALASLPALSHRETAELVDLFAKSASIGRTGANSMGMSQPVLQVGNPIFPIDDGQFVWGPNVGNFDVAAYLQEQNSPLTTYASEVELWARSEAASAGRGRPCRR